ncbi:replication-relaxation family protein [Mycolicibacterium sp. Y3]
MKPRDLHELASWLSERDIAVLQSVAEHQFLTVGHVEALHFATHAPVSGPRIARRTLARLRHYRLLGTLQRRIGGVKAGSAGLIHYVDSVGDQLLRSRSGRDGRRRSREPSSRFLSHRLAIADAHVALVTADRHRQIALTECALEPASWRRFTGLGAARLLLKPDLYLETAVSPDSDFVHAWFVEVDLGTEGIQTLLKKCREYESYRRSGVEQDATGSFPLVVWSITHADPVKAERRRDALRQAIAADRSLLAELFRIVTPEQLAGALQHRGQQ